MHEGVLDELTSTAEAGTAGVGIVRGIDEEIVLVGRW